MRFPSPIQCLGLPLALLAGCVGTDIIADPPLVVPPRLEVSPSMAAVQIGERQALHAAFYDEFGESADVRLLWSSLDTGIAVVDTTGIVEAIGEGQVSIVATALRADTVAATVTTLLTVVADPATQLALIRVAPTEARLSVGDTLRFTAAALSASGDTLETDTVTWTSSDPSVLLLDDTGQAIALGGGEAEVRAASGGILSGAVFVRVAGLLKTGAFFSHGSYTAEGSAMLSPEDDGRLVLSFSDDFRIDQGPRLEVFLSPVDRIAPGAINIGQLQATQGAQRYEVPADLQLGDVSWVIVHCVPFNVTFGLAQLQ